MTVNSSATLEHLIGSSGQFHLRLLSGSVEVRAIDGEAVRIRERSGKSLTDIFAVEATEGRLSLTSPDRGGIDLVVFGIGRRSSVDLEVEVPRGAEVSIESASAEIDATGLAGSTRIRTASGDIDLRDQAGNVELDAVSGEVNLVASRPIDLRCRTISGDLSIRAPRLGRAVIETTSGDVRLDAAMEGTGPFEIQTVSGDATIVGRTGLRIEARTVTGDLHSDLPHRRDASPGRKQLIVGDGGTAMTFRSVSGDLRVVAARDGSTLAARPSAPVAPTSPAPPMAPAMPASSIEEEPTGAERSAAGHEVARLDILHALERGELSVEAAMKRLADIEEA